MWRAPEKGETAGWQVPALPEDLDQEPVSTGNWHLPKPQDTPFTPQDTLKIPAPEDQLFDLAVAQTPEPTPAASSTPTPAPLSPEDQLLALATGSNEPKPKPTPTPSAPASPEDMLLMLDKVDTDDDFDTFSMSELMALADLVDREPGADVTPGASAAPITPIVPVVGTGQETANPSNTAKLSPAERALMPSGAADPGEYARRALQQLDSGGPTADPVPTYGAPSNPSADPGAYARQALASLEGASPPIAGTPTVNVSAVDPRLEELARRYRETEDEVRSLRRSLQTGALDQATFEEQLRSLMILDDDQIWWMMGAETDNWYKYENGEWTLAVPPALQAVPAPQSPQATLGGTGFGSLNYLEESQNQTVPTGGINLDDSVMPLPRAGVPVVDQDRTVVGAAYLDQVRPVGSEATAVNYNMASQPTVAGPAYSQQTMAATPVNYGSVEAPFSAAEPPSLDDDFDDDTPPSVEEAIEAERGRTVRRLITGVVVVVVLVFVLLAGWVVIALLNYNQQVEPYKAQIEALANYEPEFQSVTLLDFRGEPLAVLSAAEGQDRRVVELTQMSPALLHAIISMENPTFYEDAGWDIGAVLLGNAGRDETFSQANLTITQQIAQGFILGGDTDPVLTGLVAGELTRAHSRSFILRLYLNESSFGNGVFGAEAASRFYFADQSNFGANVSAANLNLAQAAFLAAILSDPATYNPITSRQATFDQTRVVLNRMAEVGCLNLRRNEGTETPERFCITEADINDPQTTLDLALIETADYEPRDSDAEYPHFTQLVRAQLETAFGVADLYSAGYTVTTTLAPELQEFVQAQMAQRLRQVRESGVSTGAVIVSDATNGAVRAYLGSPDFNDTANEGQNDYARIFQQAGTSIQPLIYTTALYGVDRNGNGSRTDQGEYLTPASILWDVRSNINGFTPVNLTNAIFGPVSLRVAAQGNYNISATKTLNFVGVDNFVQLSTAMGMQYPADRPLDLSLAEGNVPVRLYDMMEAYNTLANEGAFTPLHVIERVQDAQGNDVPLPDVLAALRPDTNPERVISPQVAYLMQTVLSSNAARVASGVYPEANPLTLGTPPIEDYVAAVAGTTRQGTDFWTIGFINTFTVGVWMGRPDDTAVLDQTGLSVAAPLWNRIMTEVIRTTPNSNQPFENPGNVVTVPICPDTGVQAAQGTICSTAIRSERFDQNRRPPPPEQGLLVTVPVNTWAGLIANEFCNLNPGDVQNLTFVNISDPDAINWLRTDGRATAQRLGLPADLRGLPPGACDANTQLPVVNLTSPANGQEVIGPIEIRGQVTAPANFARYQVEYAPVNTDSFTIIGNFNPQQQPIPDGVLTQWDTRTVPNGDYRLRLAVFSIEGGFIYREITVRVNNPLPTPTPTPTITPTPIVVPTDIATQVPLPIESTPGFTIITPAPIGGATPTTDPSGF
jgi:penicillin-binding protein 1A